MIRIANKDIFWGFFAQFFSVASGLVILPLVLSMLSEEEIGLNYLLLTFASLISLLDFGFSSQIGRNISYVFGGAQKLLKEGVTKSKSLDNINFKLLINLINSARFVYSRISLFALIILLTLGSWYISVVTENFKTVDNAFAIWVLFSVSIAFEIYFSYYSALLVGKGLIMESRKSIVFSKTVYIIISIILLKLNLGLFGIVIANFISPFVSRLYSHRIFFNNEFKTNTSGLSVSKTETIELVKVIWHNSKKIGLVFIGSFAINKFSLFIAGLYLPIDEVGSYGLMLQLFSFLTTISSTLIIINNTKFAFYRVKSSKNLLIREFAFTMFMYYIMFILGVILLIYIGPITLNSIHSQTQLPNKYILIIFSIVILLEGNHSNFANLIVTKNKVPFVKSTLIAGFFIAIGDLICLFYLKMGVLGLVIVQGVVQLSYANWKWPKSVFNEFNIGIKSFIILGFEESTRKLRLIRK
jgi:O-antigen/teichoic acid export membrane protein